MPTQRQGQRPAARQTDAPRAIAIPSQIMAAAGDTSAGLLLAQLLYWTRHGAQHDGWIHKTAAQWQQETGMSWKAQHRARSLLLARGLIEERHSGMPSRLEFRLNVPVLAKELGSLAGLEVGHLSLPAFLELPVESLRRLIGRAFLFHSRLTRIWPVSTTMLCSRLLVGVNLNHLGVNAESSCTRLTRLHRKAWLAETGLSRDQWQTARRNLASAGVLIERRHNFPRRVDLGIDLQVLARVLKAGPVALSAALPRAVLGDHPYPPAESPDPAYCDRPILPISVSQSHLYLLWNEELQPPQHPVRAQEEPQACGASAWTGWGWAAKGYASQKTSFGPLTATVPGHGEGSAEEPPPSGDQPPPPAPAPASLSWPGLFTEDDKVHAGRHLAGLERSIQQLLLDEIEWQSNLGTTIRSPVALTRALARKVNEGTFSADGAHRVAEVRRRKALEQAEALEVRRRHAEAPQPVVRSPEVIARIQKILGRSVGRMQA